MAASVHDYWCSHGRTSTARIRCAIVQLSETAPPPTIPPVISRRFRATTASFLDLGASQIPGA
jgi:hypothetical protein